MPRYAPLPSVSIDPRSDAQLAQSAAQVVYESSNQTLNDFSSGNPLSALLEGQAFAQGELLFWANQLPDKILIEWIGPFLGAMRRLGTPAATLVKVTIPPQNVDVTIPAGSVFTTNSQLTGGQSFTFINANPAIIPAGSFEVDVPVYSKFIGSEYNAPANSIVSPPTLGISGIEVTNPQPAVGGSDVETYQQVQERFFTLIRRKNPVSQSDWRNFFIDLYGEGTLTSVQPNRSSLISYNYLEDYVLPNGQVSFFVLGPEGVELTEDQLRRGQNIINFSVPIENQGHLYPITLSQVQYNLTLEVDANGIYGSNFQPTSLNFRDRAYSVLTPGSTFPVDVNPTVSDVDSAFYNTFDSVNRFKDPMIVSSAIYNTPTLLSKSGATYTNVYDFDSQEFLLNSNDLLIVQGANTVFYPVEQNFTPYSIAKVDQTIYGNLALKQVKQLSTGQYNLGDVVSLEEQLFVVLENINIGYANDVANAFLTGKISSAKTFSPWVVGNSYQYSSGTTINPEIIEYDYAEDEFLPSTLAGKLVWLVAQNFTLQAATNDITGAQAEFKIGQALNSGPQNLNQLVDNNSYDAYTWVFTPLVGGGPNAEVDPYYNYVDLSQGAVNKYAYVQKPFTYSPGGSLTSEYFDSLVEQGIISNVTVFDAAGGLPIYRYKPRFKCGQYLEYREVSDGDPTYCIAASYFTPNSTAIQDLIDQGLVINLAPNTYLKNQLVDLINKSTSGRIQSLSVFDSGSRLANGSYTNIPLSYDPVSPGNGFNASLNLVVRGDEVTFFELSDFGRNYEVGDVLRVDNSYLNGTEQEFTVQVSSLYPVSAGIKSFARMFTFYKGDRTFFRNGNNVQSYTATSNVTPLFDFSIYYKDGVFIETEIFGATAFDSEIYIPYFSPEYTLYAEDTVIGGDGRNLYRVMKAFTPQPTVTNWTSMIVNNSARYEEYSGNLLRYVSYYRCEEEILSQFGLETSSIKLGVSQISIVPRNSGRFQNSNQRVTYVWENTSSFTEVPELSWYTGSSFPYLPPNYKEGTLSL